MQMLKHTGLGYLALLLAFAMHVAPDATADKVEGAGFAPSFDVASHVSAAESKPLDLCDCEPATGSPYGLSCEKEGYFVSGFEREGQWLAGGGQVPLSRAVCCRPCLPKALPPGLQRLGGHDNVTTAVAIVSIGCHKSSAQGAQQLQCETAASLVAGYAEANRVSAALDAYYPVGAAECCTPSVLLSNGDAWELERCDCQTSDSINCGGKATNRLLAGYEHWRMTFATQYVPVAPAKCCKACLSSAVHRMDTCADQNMCSGRGVCILGQCECLGGWRGADCSARPPGAGSKDLPNWLVAIIVLGACIGVSILLALIGRVLRHFDILPHGDDASEDGDPAAEPLLAGLDDEVGSVGSEDTTDCDSDMEAAIGEVASATREAGEASDRTAEAVDQVRLESVERLIGESQRRYPANLDAGIEYAMREMEAIIADAERGDTAAVAEAMRAVEAPLAETIRATYRAEALRHARHSAAGGGSGEAAAASSPAPAGEAAADATVSTAPQAAIDSSGESGAEAAAVPPPHTSIEIQAARSAHEPEARDEDAAVDEADLEAAASKAHRKAQLVEEGRRQSQASGLLASLDCSVCLTRPIQVVVIPCGHACMCRRCSRRLQRCPICRREVVRRQRLFVGG
jgi:syndecan 1